MPQDMSPGAAPSASTRRAGYLFDDTIYRALRELGLTVRIEFDVDEFKRFIHGTEWPVVNSAVDPAFHDFAAGEVFWMRLLHGGETVATQVFRMITTDDYIGMIGDHTLFYGNTPSEFRDFRLLPAPGEGPRLGGLVVQLAGLYIRPDWRRACTADGTRLVAAWVRLSHSFTARNLMADWSVSLLEQRLATPRMIEELYGYPHAMPVFETYVPEFDRHKRVTLVWMSAAELAASVASRPRPAGRPDRRIHHMAESAADI
ncbi:MAG: hypothetical protein JO021_09570 [Alphaproteobacteria bacterium]|nr:hypothetical protein [Alphaproteobacteria bacterium]